MDDTTIVTVAPDSYTVLVNSTNAPTVIQVASGVIESTTSSISPSSFWNMGGVYVGSVSPSPLLSYADWVAGGGIGYWAWIDISSEVSVTPIYVSSIGGFSIGGTSSSAGTYYGVNTGSVFSYGGVIVGGVSTSSYNQGVYVSSTGGIVEGTASAVISVVLVTTNYGLTLAGTSAVSYGTLTVTNTIASVSGGTLVGGSSSVNSSEFAPSTGGAVAGGYSYIGVKSYIVSTGGFLVGGGSNISQSTLLVSSGGILSGGLSPIVVQGTTVVSSGILIGGTSVASYHSTTPTNVTVSSGGGVLIGGISVTSSSAAATVQYVNVTDLGGYGSGTYNLPAGYTITANWQIYGADTTNYEVDIDGVYISDLIPTSVPFTGTLTHVVTSAEAGVRTVAFNAGYTADTTSVVVTVPTLG